MADKDETVIDNGVGDDKLQDETSTESTPEVLAGELGNKVSMEPGANGAQVAVEGDTGNREYVGDDAFNATHSVETISGVMRGFSGF